MALPSSVSHSDHRSFPPTIDHSDPKTRRYIRLVLVGNFLEYYDLTLFIHLTFLLNPMFLPKGDPFVEILGKVFLFCSAYLMRPMGALFWGWMGDRYGRVSVLVSTLVLMGMASTAITTIPSYESWGWYSTALVLLCRFTQGFAAGGELQAATIYFAEYSKIPQAYYRDGLIGSTCSMGRLFAGLMITICLTIWPEKGWMVPFWLGGVLAVLVALARQALAETPDFIHALEEQEHQQPPLPNQASLAAPNLWSLRLTLSCLYAMGTISTVFTFGYCPDQLSKLGIQPALITAQSTILAGCFALSDYGWGYLAYRTQKPFLIFKLKAVALATVLLSVLLFALPPSFLLITFVQLLGVLDSEAVPLTPLFIKRFPVFWRCRNIMLTWSITKAVMYLVTTYLAFWLSAKYGERAVIGLVFAFSLLYVWGAFRAERLLKPFHFRVSFPKG